VSRVATETEFPNVRGTTAHGHGSLGLLLHALNQPLTGLQCSLELASAGPRSAEQYRRTLQDALELVERVRILVETLRELAEARPPKTEDLQMFPLDALLRETVDSLRPVAEIKQVWIKATSKVSVPLQADRGLPARIFRLLDSALSLAQEESTLEIAATVGNDALCLALSWTPGAVPAYSPFSRPELGLLIAQTEWERAGAKWDQLRSNGREIYIVRIDLLLTSSSNCQTGGCQ